MAGKSSMVRMLALITILAQIGSFVPAKSASIFPVDKIFTRIGAYDRIAYAESTFMVEMIQMANILNNATEESLIILDEIGRGTSTYDGVSIAYSILDYIHDNIKAKTVFTTHFHELTKLESKYKRIVNYNVSVKENQNEIIFLHTLKKGGTDKSYGIQVAKLAGIPDEVIKKSYKILKEYEGSRNINESLPLLKLYEEKEDDLGDKTYLENLEKKKESELGLSFNIFESLLNGKKINELSALEGLNILHKIYNMLVRK